MEKLSSFMVGKELSRGKLFKVLDNGCDGLLNDVVGSVMDLTGIHFEGAMNHTEGKMRYRTILFTDEGKSYATGSSSLKVKVERIIDVFGEPSTWDKPLKVQVVKEELKGIKNPVLSLKVVED